MGSEPAVYAVDDDLLTRILLEEVFASANISVETYASAEDFLPSFSPDNSGCLLLDIMMPGMDGLELMSKLTDMGNRTPVVFLSGADEVATAVQALKAGAVDFIEKPVNPERVLRCVNHAMALDLQNRYQQLQRTQVEQRIAQLTAREAEVMKWVIRGKSNKMIARILKISSRTVEVHRKKMYDKMCADSVADLVKMALSVEEG